MLLPLDFTNIAQQNTNLHGGTYSPRKYFHHTSPILFLKKKFFQNFVGPFFGDPGALAPIFEFPFSRYVSPYFSDVSNSFLTSFFTVVPKGYR